MATGACSGENANQRTACAMTWLVYIVRCSDASLYTGITKDIARRMHEHNELPLGSKYVKSRRPVTLVYLETAATRSAAQKREAKIKKLTKDEKEALIGITTAAKRAG